MIDRILLAIQFWEGDRARAMELARFLTDLEPARNHAADFLFVARFDCKQDPATVSYVSRKFNVFTYTSRGRATGWPQGCNELWFSVMRWAEGMLKTKRIPAYKAIFTFEADGGPVQRDWVIRLCREWDRVCKPKPVVIAGALVSPGPHINGNALVSCHPNFLKWVTKIGSGLKTNAGWDYVLARDFERIGWADIPGIKSIYNIPTFTKEQYESAIAQDWIWIHGVKDTSLIQLGRQRFKV